MDNLFSLLYNLNMPIQKNSFRSVYDGVVDSRFYIKVLGFGQFFDNEVNVPKGQNDYFIFFFEPGMYIDKENGILNQKAVYIQEPNHPILHGKAGGFTRSWIRFNGSAINSWLTELALKCNKPLYISEIEDFENILLWFRKELTHSKGTNQRILQNLFLILLHNIVRELNQKELLIQNQTKMALEYIEKNYREKISLEKISRFAGVSITHLCRLFKRDLKRSPLSHITKLRIDHAKDLLSNPDNTIEMVALNSGFSDVYYFSRCFKKSEGMSPGQYRDNPI